MSKLREIAITGTFAGLSALSGCSQSERTELHFNKPVSVCLADDSRFRLDFVMDLKVDKKSVDDPEEKVKVETEFGLFALHVNGIFQKHFRKVTFEQAARYQDYEAAVMADIYQAQRDLLVRMDNHVVYMSVPEIEVTNPVLERNSTCGLSDPEEQALVLLAAL